MDMPMTVVPGSGSVQASSYFGNTVGYIDILRTDLGGPAQFYGSLIVGAPYFDDGYMTDNGKVFVFFGQPDSTLSTTANWTASGTHMYGRFGDSVASAHPFQNGLDNFPGLNKLAIRAGHICFKDWRSASLIGL